MPRIIAYDLARLFIGPLFLTPRGIDRVDLALARHVFSDPAVPHLGILPTPWGVRAYPAKFVCQLLEQLQYLWSEEVGRADDLNLRRLIERIFNPLAPQAISTQPKLTTRDRVKRILSLVGATGFKLGANAVHHVPEGAVYINVGQLGLAVPMFHRWLERRRDISSALMLHDVIPLEYPHLVSEAAVGHHARMVRTAARYADAMIFNTAYARESVNAAMAVHGRGDLPGFVRWLPLPSAYADAATSVPELADVNYFVVVSTIEPRKNHDLLLRVWERLTSRYGAAAPHLVVVGSLGYGSDKFVAELERKPLLRSHIHIVSGLSSPALASLVLGATGMLSPSLAEGFGLPVMEASALGVPTIASDIAAHREIAGTSTVLLPTDDEEAWERAIAALSPAGFRTRPDIPHPLTEEAYCADLLGFLTGFDCRQTSSSERATQVAPLMLSAVQ